MADLDTRSELNRLYWETEAPVSNIEETLGISRRAVYDGIEPRPAGLLCRDCDSPLVYRNRTRLENRQAECPECGAEVEVDQTEGLRRAAAPERFRDAPRVHEVRPVPAREDGPLLGLVLIAGIALGALAWAWLRRR